MMSPAVPDTAPAFASYQDVLRLLDQISDNLAQTRDLVRRIAEEGDPSEDPER
jgi:hypothetical protein